MEKTLARAIYKRMEIGRPYTTRNLYDLLDEVEYYALISEDLVGKDIRKIVSSEMWKVVKAGYAKTYTEQETLANVRGIRYGSTPTSFTTYTIRYWTRVK